MRLVIILVSVLLFLPVMAKKKGLKLEDYQELQQLIGSKEFNLSLLSENLSQDLNQASVKLNLLTDASVLLNSYPASFKIEVYEVVEGNKELLTIYRPTLFSTKKAKSFVFDIELTNLVKTSNLEINLYDSANALKAVFQTSVEVENPSETVFSSVSDSECTGVFGECHLKYILQNINFAGTLGKDIETKVDKSLNGGYLVNLPLSKSKKALKIINKVNSRLNNDLTMNGNELNFEFDGTKLFIVADDGTKILVAAQGPPGAQGSPGAQGPPGPTGFGVTSAAGGTGAVQFNTASALDGDATQLFWSTATNRLGIANNNPLAKLHADAINPGISLALFRNTNDNQELEINSITGEGIHLQAGAGDKMVFSTNDTSDPNLVIDSAGNVGIGIANPAYNLQVNGTIQIFDSINPRLRFTDTDGGGSRPRLVFESNDEFHFVGDDAADKAYVFSSLYATTRTNDSELRVLGDTVSTGATLGNYIALKHDGANGELSTDLGDINLNPASESVAINMTADNAFALSVNGDVWINKLSSVLQLGSMSVTGGPHGIKFRDAAGSDHMNLYFRTGTNALSIEDDTDGSILFSIDHDDESAFFNGNLGVAGIDTPVRSIHIGEAMRLEPQTSPPSSPALGDIYVDDSEAVCVYVDGTWTKLAGTGTCS